MGRHRSRGLRTLVAGSRPEPRQSGDKEEPIRVHEEPARDPVDAEVVERLKNDPDMSEVAEIAEQLVER